MSNELSFHDFYSLMKVEGLIIIEDTMQFDSKRTAIIYDYLKMSNHEQELFLEEIKDYSQIVIKLRDLAKSYSDIGKALCWKDVPPRDIEYYLKKNNMDSIITEAEKLDDEEIKSIKKHIERFGFGLKTDAVSGYVEILKGTYESNEKIPLRIYNDFGAEECKNIKNDIDEFSKDNNYFICVIDDYLGRNPRGDEIIEWLNKNQKVKSHAICLLLSSRERAQLVASHDNIFVEYVKKGDTFLEENIKKAFIKSQYSIMLQILKQKRINSLTKTYDYALDNLNIAVHLSAMAIEEGITNYEVITNWLELREKYSWQIDNKSETQSVILLSSMLNILADEKFETEYLTDEIKEMQIFEKYDYSINELFIPPMTGDIFYVNNKYYLLAGQECDLSIRNGKRNNPIAELLPINLLTNHDMGKFKEKYGYERIVLGNFKTILGDITSIAIDCTQRHIIDNEILDICIFNNSGKSKINLDNNLTLEQKCLLPIEWESYFESIKKRMTKLVKIKENITNNSDVLEFGVEDIIESMGASHNDRLMSIIDFSCDNKELNYNVQRICRIKNHMLLANKLYLEYRGRQAFNTINMDVGKSSLYTLKLENYEYEEDNKQTVIILTNKRAENDESKLKNRDWIVNKIDIVEFLKNKPNIDFEKYITFLECEENEMLLSARKGKVGNDSIEYTKLSKDNKLTLKLKLLKG